MVLQSVSTSGPTGAPSFTILIEREREITGNETQLAIKVFCSGDDWNVNGCSETFKVQLVWFYVGKKREQERTMHYASGHMVCESRAHTWQRSRWC